MELDVFRNGACTVQRVPLPPTSTTSINVDSVGHNVLDVGTLSKQRGNAHKTLSIAAIPLESNGDEFEVRGLDESRRDRTIGFSIILDISTLKALLSI